MKKIICGLGLLCIISSCFASSTPDDYPLKALCTKLNITVDNQTHSVCYLIQKDISHGKVISKEDFNQIPMGESRSFRVIDTMSFDEGPTVTLFYACGNGMVAIKNYKNACLPGGGGAVKAGILSIYGMNAEYQTKPASAWFGTRGSVVWSFSSEVPPLNTN